jgi:general secretion pathway protein N
MRVRLPVGRSLFLAAAILFALVALLPMRLALDWLGFAQRGLGARAATGSVWLGALQEAQVGPVALGDVKARLNVLPLLLGRARVSLQRPGNDAPFEGGVTLTRHGFAVDDVSGRLRTGALFGPLPIAAVDLDDVSAAFAGGRCTRAEGRVRADVSGVVAGLGLAPGLGGNLRCAEDALLLPLVSQTGMERLDIRFFADGRYRADLLVRSADPAIQGRLAAAGFRASANGHALRIEGRF